MKGFDLGYYNIEKKQRLNELKRKENCSDIYKRTIDIISKETQESIEDLIESDFNHLK